MHSFSSSISALATASHPVDPTQETALTSPDGARAFGGNLAVAVQSDLAMQRRPHSKAGAQDEFARRAVPSKRRQNAGLEVRCRSPARVLPPVWRGQRADPIRIAAAAPLFDGGVVTSGVSAALVAVRATAAGRAADVRPKGRVRGDADIAAAACYAGIRGIITLAGPTTNVAGRTARAIALTLAGGAAIAHASSARVAGLSAGADKLLTCTGLAAMLRARIVALVAGVAGRCKALLLSAGARHADHRAAPPG